MSQPPRNRPPGRPPSSGQRPPSTSNTPPPRNVNAPRRSDPFPIIIGGIIGALVIGLLVVVYLISSNNGSSGGTSGGTTSGNLPTNDFLTVPVATQPSESGGTTEGTPTTASEQPPRITLEDFSALYNDPAKRPLIIDVRAKDIYDAGHIKGAESFPESDVDTRVGELPKDKLIVAYCQ